MLNRFYSLTKTKVEKLLYITLLCFLYWKFNSYSLVSNNTGTSDLVTWPVKRKLFVPMEDTDAWFVQQGVRPIESSTHVRLHCCRFCCRYWLFEHIFTYLCIIHKERNATAKYANCEMQNRIHQSSAKFMHGKKTKYKFRTFISTFSRNLRFNS